MEARLATSRVVRELLMDEPATLRPLTVVQAGGALPPFTVGFELENGERCTVASLMGEETTPTQELQRPAAATDAGRSAGGGLGEALRATVGGLPADPVIRSANAASSSTAAVSPAQASARRSTRHSTPSGGEEELSSMELTAPAPPLTTPSVTCTLVRVNATSRRVEKTYPIDDLGGGRFALSDDEDGLIKVGQYNPPNSSPNSDPDSDLDPDPAS